MKSNIAPIAFGSRAVILPHPVVAVYGINEESPLPGYGCQKQDERVCTIGRFAVVETPISGRNSVDFGVG